MLILLALLGIVCLYKIKLSPFHEDYMSRSQSGAIKGIFAVIILFSHLKGYITLSGPLDSYYDMILRYIGQLMVTMFFFYSGYGIIKSYQAKENYSKGFVKNRILKTLLHFDIAVLCFFILSLVVGNKYEPLDYLLAFTGWTSLGNSNWFIFVILALYVITAIAFWVKEKLLRSDSVLLIPALTSLLSVCLWIALYISGKDAYWYNTLLCYGLGMWFALIKDRLDALMKKNIFYNFGAVILSAVIFVVSYKTAINSLLYSVLACVFCLTLTMITTKVKIDNPILAFLGKYSFEIYIFQRIPMIILSEMAPALSRYVFAALSIIISLALAVLFSKLYAVIDKKLFASNVKVKV